MDIPIFKKTYDLWKEFYAFELDFPKKDRYTLGQRCENCMLNILEGIIIAAQAEKPDKLKSLMLISHQVDMLKVFIRLATDVRALTDQRYIVCQNHLQEIGKMIGGWIKSSRE